MSRWTQTLATSLYGIDKWRIGEGATMRYLRDYEASQYWTPDQIRSHQLEALRQLIAHAVSNCPFYRDRYREAKVATAPLPHLESLSAFPTLEKRDIQTSGNSMVATNWPTKDLIPNFSGGSTGEPIAVMLHRDRKCSREAATRRHNAWAGYRIGDKLAAVWGAPLDAPQNTMKNRLRNLILDRTLHLNSGALTESDLEKFASDLQAFRPRVVQGYAKSLALVAQFLRDRKLAIPAPKGIISSAEQLTDDDRRLIEGVFNAPVYNRYGCREVSVIASECEHRHGLHLMAECLIVEVVDSQGRPVPQGESGTLLVTDLFNYAMPLIRYRVGDVGSLSTRACPCGRGLPLLEKVDGRVSDFLVGGDGRLVSGPYIGLYLVGKCPHLGQIQIRQESAGRVHFKVTAFPTAKDIQFIEDMSVRMLGQDTVVDVEHVATIPKTASGKTLLCQSSATAGYMQLNPATQGT